VKINNRSEVVRVFALKPVPMSPLSHGRGHGGRGRGALNPLLQHCNREGAWLQPHQTPNFQTPVWHAETDMGG